MSWPWIPPFPQPVHGSAIPPGNEGAFGPQTDCQVLPQTSFTPSPFSPELNGPHSALGASFPINSGLATCFPPALPPPPPPPPFLGHYQDPEISMQYQNNTWQRNSFPNNTNTNQQFASLGISPPSAAQCPFPLYSSRCRGETGASGEHHDRTPNLRTETHENGGRSRARRSNPCNNGGGVGADGGKGKVGNRPTGTRDGSKRDWELSRNVLNRLGKSLPGESPEDVARWIAERKRNWPSRQKVEQKNSERAHGERMGELPTNGNRENSYRRRSRPTPTSRAATTPRSTVTSSKQSNAFVTIAEQYQSSCEEGEVLTDDAKQSFGTKPQQNVNADDFSKPEDGHDPSLSVDTPGPSTRKRNKYRNRRRSQRKKRRECKQLELTARHPSLLRKLLEKEIRSEHSLLLQAFRHLLNKDSV